MTPSILVGMVMRHEPTIPLLSMRTEAPTAPDRYRCSPALVRQVVSPVLWEESIRALMADGFDKFYEIGPGRVLAGLLKRVQRKADCTNVPA